MKRLPSNISIVQNDSWAAPLAGAFIMSLTITIIILATNYATNRINTNPIPFMWMAVITFLTAVLTAIWRIRYVTQIFENGVEIKAQVTEIKSFRSAMKFKLQYTYLGQTIETKLEQVITSKTKKFLMQKEVILIIDPENPENILLRDVYL